jgi:surfeit locus 1 family protein
VDALTELGPGFWVMTPMVTPQGIVLVNRGFVPPSYRQNFPRPQGELAVTGLLRMSEPGGRFLRPNRPAAGLWYSRDVATIAAARRLGPVAPFFVDAEGGSGYPVGGLTVVQFRNMHLAYAVTWFCLAAMAGFGAWSLYRGNAPG